MKNLNSFKAFELGKAQMNAISGGKEFYCTGENRTDSATFNVDTIEQAYAGAREAFGGKATCEEVIKV